MTGTSDCIGNGQTHHTQCIKRHVRLYQRKPNLLGRPFWLAPLLQAERAEGAKARFRLSLALGAPPLLRTQYLRAIQSHSLISLAWYAVSVSVSLCKIRSMHIVQYYVIHSMAVTSSIGLLSVEVAVGEPLFDVGGRWRIVPCYHQ